MITGIMVDLKPPEETSPYTKLWFALDNAVNQKTKAWYRPLLVLTLADGFTIIRKGSKSILDIPNETELKEFKAEIQTILHTPKYQIHIYDKNGNDTGQTRPFKLHFKTITVADNPIIHLKKATIPVTRHSMTKKQILDVLRTHASDRMTDAEAQEYEKAIDKITSLPNRDDYCITYYRSEESGQLHRITYFDGQRRQQTAVGDIVAALNKTRQRLQVVEDIIGTRKTRTDSIDSQAESMPDRVITVYGYYVYTPGRDKIL